MWEARYCIGEGGGPSNPRGRGDLRKFEAETVEEIKQWAQNLERTEGIKNTIFNSDFKIDEDDFKQWGTNYWWLSVQKV